MAEAVDALLELWRLFYNGVWDISKLFLLLARFDDDSHSVDDG